jgi:hypothetical protein
MNPLGDWTNPSHQNWYSYVDQEFQFYKTSKSGSWEIFSPLTKPNNNNTRAGTGLWYDSSCSITRPPNNSCPATKQSDPTTLGSVFKVNYSTSQLITAAPQAGANREDHPFYTRLLGPITATIDNLSTLAIALSQGTLHFCCDGAHDPLQKVFSHGWVVADPEGSVLWEGAGPVDGPPSQQNPYRAELHGVLAVLYILYQLENTSHVRGRVFIYCDNLKAVKKTANKSPIDIKTVAGNDADIMMEIKEILPKTDSTIEMTWVKGHYNGPEQHIK